MIKRSKFVLNMSDYDSAEDDLLSVSSEDFDEIDDLMSRLTHGPKGGQIRRKPLKSLHSLTKKAKKRKKTPTSPWAGTPKVIVEAEQVAMARPGGDERFDAMAIVLTYYYSYVSRTNKRKVCYKTTDDEYKRQLVCQICGVFRPQILQCCPEDANLSVLEACHPYCVQCMRKWQTANPGKTMVCNLKGHVLTCRYVCALVPGMYNRLPHQRYSTIVKGLIKCRICVTRIDVKNWEDHKQKCKQSNADLLEKVVSLQTQLDEQNKVTEEYMMALGAAQSAMTDAGVALPEGVASLNGTEGVIAELKSHVTALEEELAHCESKTPKKEQ